MDIQYVATRFYDYLTHIKGYSKETIRRYKYVINLYCKISNISSLQQVSPTNVRGLFYHGRTERKWAPNTFIIFHKSLKVFFRYCIEQGLMRENPLNDLEKPKVEFKIPVKLTKQEALRLLELIYNFPKWDRYLRARNHALFSTFVHAGLRRSELIHLQYSDVDLDNHTIFVRQGKGAKDRMIPISPALAVTLHRYTDERNKAHKSCPEFFASSKADKGITLDGLKHLIDQVCRITGVKFSSHKLRHTFATLMLEGGCDIYSLSKMMGHTDIKTTTIYLSASIEHLRTQIDKHPLNWAV
jgi:site-specific recombinase XerD